MYLLLLLLLLSVLDKVDILESVKLYFLQLGIFLDLDLLRSFFLLLSLKLILFILLFKLKLKLIFK